MEPNNPRACPYCGSTDLVKCVRVIMRHTNQGMLSRWIMILINRHDTTDTDVWFYPTWHHGMNIETVRLNARWLLTVKGQ